MKKYSKKKRKRLRIFIYLYDCLFMTKKVTIKDIARELNTTYSTVSRALNNNSGISKEKRRIILVKAKGMGYEPNIFAQQLRRGGSTTIGLIVPRINRVFFSNVIHGVEKEAKLKGFTVLICQSNETELEEKESIRTLLTNNVAGIIMSISKETGSPGLHREIIKRKIPFVMFDRVFRELETNMVLNDNYYGAYAVTEHMIEQGYRNIVHFAGPLTINIYRDRMEGYKKAMEERQLSVFPERIIENVITKDMGYESTGKLYDSDIEFDGIFAASDFSALGALLYLQSRGIKVPGGVGVAGYANEPFTELVQLTTVEQHSTEIGRSAARLLFEEIDEGGIKEMSKEVIIKPELIIRKSTLKKTNHEI